MLAELGYGILLLTFVVALFSAGAALTGYKLKNARWVEASRRGMQLAFPLVTLASGILVYLLATNAYNVQYVWSVISDEMPLYLKITAWWGGQAGSLLFWSWLLAAFASAVTLRNWDRDRELLPWVMLVTSVTLAFFLAMNIFFKDENPFARFWQTMGGEVLVSVYQPAGTLPFNPGYGQGLNPLLRHPGMIIHPPTLYLGFVSYVIPYAFAMAALITGRSDDRWIRITRRWSLWAWLFLSCGLVLGMRWAYDVLGWGGYWGWDPVEIAALLPWLAGTPFLHTVIIQEKRGMFKKLNMVLIILTYVLVIFGTFLTRSGVLSSVHSFAQSAIGPMFFAFIGISLMASFGLLIHRWGDLRSESSLGKMSMLSREALFLLAALLFGGFFIVSFWGIIYPIISEIITGQRVTFGPAFYRMPVGVILAGLMALMGIAPLSSWTYGSLSTIGKAAWKPLIPTAVVFVVLVLMRVLGIFGSASIFETSIRWTDVVALIGYLLIAFVIFVTLFEFGRAVQGRCKTQGEAVFAAIWNIFKRNRRRYGGYIVHIAMVIMALGIIGIEVFQTTTQKSLATGESINISGYTVRFDSLAQFPTNDGRRVTRAAMSLFQGEDFLGEIHPRFDVYPDGQPMTIPGVRSTLKDDIYVVLVNWEQVSADQAPFKVYHNPLIQWLWIGGLVFILGILVTAYPDRERTNGKR